MPQEEAAVPTTVRGGIGRSKEKAPRTKKSCFLVTLSTNQRYKGDDPHKENDEEVFDHTVKDILGDLPRYMKVLEDGHIWES